MRISSYFLFIFFHLFGLSTFAQIAENDSMLQSLNSASEFDGEKFQALTFRNIGPFRGGRSNAVSGVIGDPLTYYFGSTGGGVWKTGDAGLTWKNISDGFFNSGSVGVISVAQSNQNVVYVGMGEHAVRGVMTSHGDGVYKSLDAGKTWEHIGLENSRHISEIIIHPKNPEVVYVAVQGPLYEKSKEKGIYKTEDGGATWKKILFVDENTGAADLSMDLTNPRIMYAGMWDHQRMPWKIRSGGKGSGIYKSIDSGANWERLSEGLPELMGKVAVDVSLANPEIVYANIEAKKGGIFKSTDAGKTWKQTNAQRTTVARAWYYIEIFADPVSEETVYVLNAPVLKSVDGGKTFENIPNPHTDQHDLWINPSNPKNMILANDGGACITFNGGKSWSTQSNQPTAQFYRVITDNQVPYRVYAGQQDNSAISIKSRTMGGGINEDDWHSVAGGESAFIAFNPNNPQKIYGTSIQGIIDVYDAKTETRKNIMAYPQLNLGTLPKDMKYRFNWNNPIVALPQNPQILYYGAQLLLKTKDGGQSWFEISPDLTRNDTTRHGDGGEPFTNEAAGGEVYNTISYIACSPQNAGVIWVGTDDGLIHLTKDEGKTWTNITPSGLNESLINAIEVSPHDPATAYIAVTRYKFGDLSPMIFMTHDFGNTWVKIVEGLPNDNFVRVVREDPKTPNILYAGTESGLYISFNKGKNWKPFQSNLPVCPITDLCIRDNDLVVATSGRAFWILDDLGALQQTMGVPDTLKAKIIQPKPTYKYTLYSSPKSLYQGQNPANGVILDYYLPHDWTDSSKLTLEIFDANNQLVRTMSNEVPKDFKSWPGGPPKPQVLPSKAGLNRTNWDLRRSPLPAIDDVFVMGDYQGHFVAPGKYTLRLTTENDTLRVKCEVKANPAIKASAVDYERQQDILLEIDATVLEIHQSVNRFRNIKEQLKERIDLLKRMEGADSLIKMGDEIIVKIDAWETQLIQPQQETFQDVINFRNMLNAELLYLKGQIDTYDPRPTKGAENRLKDLLVTWSKLKSEMESIVSNDIEGFNQTYQKADLPILILQKVKEKE